MAQSSSDGLVLGRHHLPSGGGFLVLPNQASGADLERLDSLFASQRRLYVTEGASSPGADQAAFLEAEGREHLTLDAADPAGQLRDASDPDSVLVFVPAPAVSVSAPLSKVPGSVQEMLLGSGLPTLPLYLHHCADVALSIHPQESEEGVCAVAPLIPGPVDPAAYQEALFRLAEETFSASPWLDVSLPYALLQGLKAHGGRNNVIDGKDGKLLGFDKILAASAALSRLVRKETQKDRVGIVMPPSPGGLIANLAVLLAGKTPVNFNFTAGHAAVTSALKRSEIDRILTADPVVRKMQAFPWPPSRELMYLERLLPAMKGQIIRWLLLSKILPTPLLASLLGVAKKGGDREAVLLFTSGSSGEPKGVALTHRNVIGNVIQFGSRLQLGRDDSILGSLPLFHSFGCTVTMWYPVIEGVDLVTYPSPLETKQLASLIDQHSISLLVATPTFLRGYQRGVNPEQLASLKLVVTGAEKLPKTVAEAFEEKFDKRVYEGYGLTETTPVTNVNLPDPVPEEGLGWLGSHRFGSVGQLMPGLAIRIAHPETGEPLSLHERGMIWFKGVNVFNGYLNDEKRTAEVIDEEGWFRTGDIGRMDVDGFLYIEGRMSRFSKIAGEMVPHESVEEALNKTLGLESESVRRLAVVGVPDPDRGEALILLSTLEGGSEQQEILDLRYRLLDAGVPPLWIPKKLVRIQEVPVLASGKLDVQGCVELAKNQA